MSTGSRGAEKKLISCSSSEVQRRNLQHNDSPSIPDVSFIRSLQHSERDIFYSTCWEDHCLPSLHPIFESVFLLVNKFPVLKEATLALAACHWSRLSAERRDSTSASCMGAFSPNLTHQTRSQLYYSSAIKGFIQLSKCDVRSKAIEVFVLLILFAHIESKRGNFEGFYCHVRGLTAFINVELSSLTHDPVQKGLLTAWMQTQYWVWWARTYFSSLPVQLKQPPIPLPRVLQNSFETLYERRVVVLSILHESHRLNFQATLKHWTDDSDIDEYDSTNYCKLLEEEGKKLDEWLSSLPLSEQPLLSDDFKGSYETNTFPTPVIFRSHDAALNYAYYIVARILQCTGFLRLVQNRHSQRLGNEYYEEPWLRLLLGVVQGVDIKTSIARNTYTIGFSGLLLAALLRCQDQALGLWIEGWLQALENVHPTEEGSFPIYQALSVARAINQQRMMGRDVFGVSQPVDDGGGSPKFRCYNSQMLNVLLIHGRYRASGELFTDSVFFDR